MNAPAAASRSAPGAFPPALASSSPVRRCAIGLAWRRQMHVLERPSVSVDRTYLGEPFGVVGHYLDVLRLCRIDRPQARMRRCQPALHEGAADVAVIRVREPGKVVERVVKLS